ncbi:MAG: hypothetical protein R2792_18985 [Saprospiraceae bacterium]
MKTRPAFLLHFPAFSLFIVAMLLPSLLLAQKEDYIWVIGHDTNFEDSIFGGTILNFNSDTLSVEYFEQGINMNMYVSNSSICNSNGDLLFYSNGCDISAGDGIYLDNGNDINPGYWHNTVVDEIERDIL